jgi:hypothetical protein
MINEIVIDGMSLGVARDGPTIQSCHSADDMSQEVAEIVAAQYPNYHELDEESLDQLVNNEIGNLRPGPLDDDWPDVIDAAMTILMSSG